MLPTPCGRVVPLNNCVLWSTLVEAGAFLYWVEVFLGKYGNSRLILLDSDFSLEDLVVAGCRVLARGRGAVAIFEGFKHGFEQI